MPGLLGFSSTEKVQKAKEFEIPWLFPTTYNFLAWLAKFHNWSSAVVPVKLLSLYQCFFRKRRHFVSCSFLYVLYDWLLVGLESCFFREREFTLLAKHWCRHILFTCRLWIGISAMEIYIRCGDAQCTLALGWIIMFSMLVYCEWTD